MQHYYISKVFTFLQTWYFLLQGKHAQPYNNHEHAPTGNRQHTITINDTPSPAVSVITISDSEDEGVTGKKPAGSSHRNNQNAANNTSISHRKNVISCVSVGDSDNEENTPAWVCTALTHFSVFHYNVNSTITSKLVGCGRFQ